MDNPDFDSEMVSFDTNNPYFGSEEKLVNLRYFRIFVKRVLTFLVHLREREKRQRISEDFSITERSVLFNNTY